MATPAQTVTMKVVGGPTVILPWTQGMTAHRGLEIAYGQINDTDQFTYGLQYFGPTLGYLVFMVNETYDTFTSKAHPYFYWDFLLNGNPATKGVDGILLQSGDVFGFSFETYDAAQHAGTLLGAKHELQTRAFAKR